jgi:multidrug transporter EmrE-like cation transporter
MGNGKFTRIFTAKKSATFVSKIMDSNQDTLLFRFASKSLKYFLLVLVGIAIAYVLSSGLGILQIIPILLYLLQQFLLPLGIILLCLITTAVIIESLR